MFPTEEGKSKFGQERNDAATLGTIYPVDVPVFTNKPLDLGPVSFIFGQKVHLFGLVSHSKEEKTADGRIFTGPADFLEHDFAHAFFNLTPRIPGTDEQWELVHRRYLEIRDAVKDPKLKRMVRLVYYHFTHESGFTSLFDKKPESFDKELETIDELLHTRFHYDFILTDGLYASDDYKPYLKQAFQTVGGFFRDNFYEILATDSMCYRVLNNK
jgi:hypothetical protein